MLLAESSQPPAKIMEAVSGLDKLAHFIAFGILASLLAGLSLFLNGKQISVLSAPLLGAIFVGVLEESYQSTVTGRSASLFDLIADTCGAIFSVIMIRYIVFYCLAKKG